MSGYEEVPSFGASSSASGQIKEDDKVKKSLFRLVDLERILRPYYDFKAKLQDRYGVAFAVDYNLLYQHASPSLGEKDAAGGVLRLFGTWTVLGRESEMPGSFVYKIENRHRIAMDIAPQQLSGEVGYAGLTAVPFSNAGWLLTNLYWHQSLSANRIGYAVGLVDTTDYLDVYGLFNPWTDFSNLVFSTDPTIPAPNQGLGAAVRVMATDHLYALAGLADANGDPSTPGESLKSFFDQKEFFKHIEAGWVASLDKPFKDNIHLTAWQVDERKGAGVPDGWGAAFSFSRLIGGRWLPFLRVGYADGGGAVLERSVSAGLGYFFTQRSDVLGLGLNWGRPNEKTFGPGRDDQYTVEGFYRLQVSQHLAVTPDFQLLIHPALNPEEDLVWVLGLRARVSF